ncbi:copper(I)-binding protein [Catenuloplanes nepalensis]|uniref:Copper(I)-binding protein n=1 Tax=Catenuloplanes nepalensis TaxID=587533 RepID=A0ABT9MQ01_9ACTN|nr:copper chaperone PCu(A)C [Catenuloplanes nepalensis]MDP9793493.1 copper(I)-binding protein [Catenuloplanes nepalensis]
MGKTSRFGAGLVLALAMGGLTACATDDSTTAAPAPSATTAASAPAATSGLTMTDPWIKAADEGMTAAFGTLVNGGTTDITVVSAATAVSPMMELHETTMVNGAMQMQPKQGGFTIPAGGEHVLEPGGDHIMMMGLTTPVKAGDQVPMTLTLGDGSTVQFTAVGKPFTGAQESYAPGAHGGAMPSMSAGAHS